jgi:hypothetical protein
VSSADVEHAGWAVGGPDSRLRRRRNHVLGLLAAALIAGGAGAAVLGIVRVAREAGPAAGAVLARGTVAALGGRPAPPVRFTTAGAETLTVWLQAGGLSNVRDTVVAGTACELRRPDGSTVRIRGSRQGTAVSTDDHATIGVVVSAPGANTVACRHVPFGRAGRRGALRRQRPFVVERGSPGDGLRGLWLLFPGTAAIVLGVPLAMRWRTGSLRAA